MSGGHFDYSQYNLLRLAEEIKELIHSNDDKTLNEWGDRRGLNFDDATISEFKRAELILKLAFVYAQRIDYLVSADDGEATFHQRLKDDISEILKENEYGEDIWNDKV